MMPIETEKNGDIGDNGRVLVDNEQQLQLELLRRNSNGLDSGDTND